MTECVFCKITSGKLPCYKIYEDRHFLGFLDVYPRSKGHSLIVPKKHYRWVYDVPQFAAYWKVVLVATKSIKTALHPYFVTYVTHGFEVPHAHIHIIPRQKNNTAFVPEVISVSKKELKNTARAIHNQNKPR